jgi:hypothetical protein
MFIFPLDFIERAFYLSSQFRRPVRTVPEAAPVRPSEKGFAALENVFAAREPFFGGDAKPSKSLTGGGKICSLAGVKGLCLLHPAE